jgi:hypothetical protein
VTIPIALQTQVEIELSDPRYKNRTHYHRKTYDAGCRGPLCTTAHSERQHARYVARTGALPRRTRARERRDALAALLRAYLEERVAS